MKNILKILTALLVVVSFNSCQDSQNTIDEVFAYETGAILRTLSVDNALLNSSDATTAFVVTVEEQDAQDGALLESVDIYITLRDLTVENGTSVATDVFVKTFDASVFTTSPVGLPMATLSANYGEMFAATGLGVNDISPGDIFLVELRLNLTDGRTFGKDSAAGIITGGFFSSPFVYNALITCSPEPGDYVVDMHDSYGDGWQTNDGNAGDGISVDIDGVITLVGMCSAYSTSTWLSGTECTPNDGYDASATVTVPVGAQSATWTFPGDQYGEISFEIYAPDGSLVFEGLQGETGPGLLPVTVCAQ